MALYVVIQVIQVWPRDGSEPMSDTNFSGIKSVYPLTSGERPVLMVMGLFLWHRPFRLIDLIRP